MKVSVCIITYNHERFISGAIKSVLSQQADFEIELIIANDASSDCTGEIISDLVKHPPQGFSISYASHLKNIGMMANFVFALEQCRGEYIALCEGDDYWTDPFKLQKQVDFLELNNDYNICFHNAVVKFDDDGLTDKMYSDFPWNNILRNNFVYSIDDIISAPLIPTASILFRRPSTFVFPDWIINVASGDMALAILVCGDMKIKYFDSCWSVYRKHQSGVTVNHRGDWIHSGRIYMYLRMIEYFKGFYKQSFLKVISAHMNSLSNFSLISKDDRKMLFQLLPFQFLKNRILFYSKSGNE